ncbi:MAG: tRNA (N(6)-L-threonylcarbamoyladenosine(37)-C(2))-methylthiotransferase MtaB [Armatimonadota bacterium]|nr:MAG: tRNA (N(6)-L-threonylcarbamoyladenosine(37)-C(2))-methylthiotransferase MtaB [Armatimonadota bacterium]
MVRVAFATLGCKVNQYETQRIIDTFEEQGFAVVGFDEPAELYVVNSCSVTQLAEKKSLQIVRRVARQNPEARVVLTGCFAQFTILRGESVAEAALLVPNTEKMHTVRYVLETFPDIRERVSREPAPPALRNPYERTRAVVKIQDGCNVCCSFCSIPYTRPRMFSRPYTEVLEEIRRLVDEGFKEVVLTGVLIGSYGEDTGSGGPDLASLLQHMARIDGLERIRISSIELTQVTDRLIEVCASEPKVCPHLHIPLQSGDDRILQAMNRPYRQQDVLTLAEKLYSRIPDLAITTDIMVGFPGEDEAAFRETCNVVERVQYARAHIFRFSQRPGTPAAQMEGQVPEAEKERRSHELAELCRKYRERFITARLGRTLRVLVEGKQDKGGLMKGLTDNYIPVEFAGGAHLSGQLVWVRLLELGDEGALGELVTTSSGGHEDGRLHFLPNRAEAGPIYLRVRG